jgi:hypothetical protein
MASVREKMFRNLSKWMLRLLIALAVNGLLALIPMFAQWNGTRFMPTVKFIAVAELPVVIGALILSAGTIAAVIGQLPKTSESWLIEKPAQSIPGCLAVLLAVGYPFYINMLVTLPMTVTALWHRPMIAIHVVKDNRPPIYGRVNCLPAVSLSDMPLFYDRACIGQIAVWDGLAPTSRILLIGYGNALGVHYRQVKSISGVY